MTSLRDALQQRNPELYHTTVHIVSKATPQLWHSYATFPSGTRHTLEHTDMVEQIAGMLLRDELIGELNDDELAMLIQACHFHDLGMVGTEADNLTIESRDQVRVEHAISIGDRILEHWQAFGFSDESEADSLARICKGHRPKREEGIATWNNLRISQVLGPNRSVRLRLVSAIVYAADELHIGADRAPKREEDFLNITNPESLKHWRRHQAVQGPVLEESHLVFDGTGKCPVFEKDLRKALKKAFTALQELHAEFERASITVKTTPVRFRWIREHTWKILIAQLCSDLKPRKRGEITTTVIASFREEMKTADTLAELCDELPMEENFASEISEVLNDFCTRNVFIEENQLLTLSTHERVTNILFDNAKTADEYESIFVDQAKTQYEYQLLKSALGSEFLRKQVLPLIRTNLNVDLARFDDDPLIRVLEESPTAIRMLQLAVPPQGVLVQSDLLLFSCLAGTCADLQNDPKSVLDSDYRRALTTLVQNATDRAPKFMLFIQELSLVLGLSYEQAFEASVASPEEIEENTRDEEKDVSININQTIPVSRPELSIGYLSLAARRAQVEITLANPAFAPLTVTTNTSNDSGQSEDSEEIAYLAIGPAKPSIPPRVSFRATITSHQDTKLVEFNCTPITSQVSGPFLSVSTSKHNQIDENTMKSQSTIRVIAPEMTVGEVSQLFEAISLIDKENYKLIFKLSGNPVKENPHFDLNVLTDGLNSQLATRLCEIDVDIPYPLFADQDDLDSLCECPIEDLNEKFNEVMSKYADNDFEINSVYIRYVLSNDVDYYEEYLGILPQEVRFNAPKVVSTEISQEEIDRKWNDGEEFKLQAYYRESVETLANELREWFADSNKDFPFGKFDVDLVFHYANTKVSTTFEEIIDRQWYKERRVVIRFKHIARYEQYAIEREYWQKEGDEDRVKLLDDLIRQTQATASTNISQGNQQEQT